MSSTGRGSDRRADDAYDTPRWVADRLADVLTIPAGSLAVEPCVGSGNIVVSFPDLKWLTNDVRKEVQADTTEIF